MANDASRADGNYGNDGNDGNNWYRRLFGSKRTNVLAPMVDQSELAFRILCLRHGADLCYSPMISSRQFADSASYRESIFGPLDGIGEDRPLVVQFAGNDPQVLLEAAKHVQHRCDAVDINFGCPQKIARRGHYGAWLSDEPQLQQQLVGTLHCHLECPVTVKIRVQEAGRSATVDYARMLQSAGASVIAVHGRTREQRGAVQGGPSWADIAAVKAAVSVPVIANGGIFATEDVSRCFEATGADGVMAGESLLENPALFDGGRVGERQPALAREYLALQQTHPSPLAGVKQHLFNLLYAHVQVHIDLRQQLHRARTLDEMSAVVDECERRRAAAADDGAPPEVRASAARSPFDCAPGAGYTSWYRRHHWEELRHAEKQAAKALAAKALAAEAHASAPAQDVPEGAADIRAAPARVPAPACEADVT